MYNLNIAMGFSESGINLLAGFVEKGKTYVLNSETANGTFLKNGTVADVNALAGAVKNVLSSCFQRLDRQDWDSLTFVIPPLDAAYAPLNLAQPLSLGEGSLLPRHGMRALRRLISNQHPGEDRDSLLFVPLLYGLSDQGKNFKWYESFPQQAQGESFDLYGFSESVSKDLALKVKEALKIAGIKEGYRVVLSPVTQGRWLWERDKAIAKSLTKDPAHPVKPYRNYVLLDFGADYSSCTLFVNRMPLRTNVIEIGWNQIFAEVARLLSVEVSKAKSLVLTYGLMPLPEYDFSIADGLTQAGLEKALKESLRPLFDPIRYWLSHTVIPVIQKVNDKRDWPIRLCGPHSWIPGLEDYFKERTEFSMKAVLSDVYGAPEGDKPELLGAFLLADDLAWTLEKDDSQTITRTTQLRI